MKFTGVRKQTALDKEIENLLGVMNKMQPQTEGYSETLDYLERLCKLKELETSRRVSPDTIAIIAGNLLGIGLILGYEKAGVITSKALGFVVRGRV